MPDPVGLVFILPQSRRLAQWLPKNTRTAGFLLRQNLQLWLSSHQDLVDPNFQKVAQSEEIVCARQALPLLPFIDRLGRLDTEEFLDLGDGESLLLPETENVLPGGDHINNRIGLHTHTGQRGGNRVGSLFPP